MWSAETLPANIFIQVTFFWWVYDFVAWRPKLFLQVFTQKLSEHEFGTMRINYVCVWTRCRDVQTTCRPLRLVLSRWGRYRALTSSFVFHTIPWFYSRFQFPSHLDPERPFCATREQWREREKIASATKKRVQTSTNILFLPTAKLILTPSCSIVGEGAVPTEEKKDGAEWCHRFREGKEKPAQCIKVSVGSDWRQLFGKE